MRISKLVAGAMVALAGAAVSSAALAHPGSKLLTTGSKSERAAMTSGVSFEDVNGVHVFRGGGAKPSALLGEAPAASQRAITRDVEIVIRQHPYRSFRRLRTQGFYSGIAYPSRQYTQGFYSGQR